MTILKIGRLFIVLALAFSVSSTAFAGEVRLKIAGTWPAKHFGNEIMEDMVKEIEAANVGLKVK